MDQRKKRRNKKRRRTNTLKMKKTIAKDLYEHAVLQGEILSGPRDKNFNEETFILAGIKPYSDHAAAITYLKSSGKMALRFAYYNNDRWFSFFPSDSVILGMTVFSNDKSMIEDVNYDKNFSSLNK